MKFGTSVEMTQKLLEEQFADLLIQLSFVSQDLVITMSTAVQTQFSYKSSSLAVKKVEDYFGRKETESNLTDFFVTSEKNQHASMFFTPEYLPNHIGGKKSQSNFYVCTRH